MSTDEQRNFSGFLKSSYLSKDCLIPGLENFQMPESIDEECYPDLKENLMLGKRAERYFSKSIELSDEYDMLLESIQVFKEKRTIGEFDFFVKRLSDNQLIHVELVYKFYLLKLNTGFAAANWVGPNLNDSLELKVDKLQKKQFPLIKSEEGIRVLESHHLNPDHVLQQLAFFGNLFLPASRRDIVHELYPEAIQGYWYTLNEFIQAQCSSCTYFIPTKIDWFMQNPGGVDWLELDELLEILQLLTDSKKSPMVWKNNPDGTVDRLFVVWWEP